MSGISTTSGVSPADTMVANFSNASPQGSEMISTLVPGLAASNLPTIDFSVSVRSGLVMTSTSFSVVSASAVPAISTWRMRRDKKLLHVRSLPVLVASGLCHSDAAAIAASRSLHSASVPSRPTWRRTDRAWMPKAMRGIGLRLLLQHDLAGHDQAFMPAPADAQLEERERVGEGADVDAVAEDEGEQARRAVEARRQPVGEAGMADRLDQRMILQALARSRAPDASCACMRIGSVRRPRISSQASNGDSLPPR